MKKPYLLSSFAANRSCYAGVSPYKYLVGSF